MSWQTVQTQIRLLLEKQSDQGLHCLQFQLHVSDPLPSFRIITAMFLGVRIYRPCAVYKVNLTWTAKLTFSYNDSYM